MDQQRHQSRAVRAQAPPERGDPDGPGPSSAGCHAPCTPRRLRHRTRRPPRAPAPGGARLVRPQADTAGRPERQPRRAALAPEPGIHFPDFALSRPRPWPAPSTNDRGLRGRASRITARARPVQDFHQFNQPTRADPAIPAPNFGRPIRGPSESALTARRWLHGAGKPYAASKKPSLPEAP